MDPIVVQQVIAVWGLPGAIIIFLIYVIKSREDELRQERQGRRDDAEKAQKKYDELQEAQLEQLKNTLEVVSNNKDNLVAFKGAQDVFLERISVILTETRDTLAKIRSNT